MSDDDGPRRPGRPAPRYGEYASPSSSDAGGSSGLSEADARIVAEAAEYRRAQAERDAPASAGRGGRKTGKAAAPQTLAEQMAEERKAARERQLAERREAERAAADGRRASEKAASAERRGTRGAPTSPPAPGPASSDGATPGTRRERPGYLAGQERRRAPRRFDAAITVGLLAAGLFNVVGSISSNADLARSLNQSFALFGFGEYTATPQTPVVGIALNFVNVIVFVLTAWIALELVKRRRIAFWVPIAGAALAALIGVILLATLVMGDPSFVQQMPGYSGS